MFHTYRDRQKEVEIDVYQGESDDVRRNARVGKFMIQGLAPVEAGNPIVVQLDLNLDGMLKVSARERATGLQKQVVIENALAQFERDAARRRPATVSTVCGSISRTRLRTWTKKTTKATRRALKAKCRRWRRGRARDSGKPCKPACRWKKRNGSWSVCKRKISRRWNG